MESPMNHPHSSPAERTRIERLVQQMANAWMAEDLDAIAAIFAEDGLFISPGGRWQGRAAIRQAVAAFFANESKPNIRIDRLVWDKDERQGAVEWVWSAVDSEGRRYVDEDGILFVLDEYDKFTYWREYFNLSSRRYAEGEQQQAT
jgi:uncharacterized protein (TIGR02246 family)